jgi:hypothetical protein
MKAAEVLPWFAYCIASAEAGVLGIGGFPSCIFAPFVITDCPRCLTGFEPPRILTLGFSAPRPVWSIVVSGRRVGSAEKFSHTQTQRNEGGFSFMSNKTTINGVAGPE